VEFNKGQKLVMMLERMTRRGGVRASELIERFELDARSLRRYLADLRDLDIPIVDDGRGEDRVVSVDARWKRTGVQLSLTEVLSLHFGRTLFNFLEGTSFQSDLEGAIERLEPAISRAHADIAKQLDTRFIAVPEHAKDYRGERSEIIDEVTTAIIYNNPIDARYRRIGGLSAARRLHPYTLAVFRQGLYLFAFDPEAQLVKTFAIERFEEVSRRRSERFELPPGWTPRAHIAHAFGIIDGRAEDVSIAFTEAVAGYIRERTWHPSQRMSTMSDGRLRLDLRVAVTIELETWILGFGSDSEVLSPAPLVDKITHALEIALTRYRRSR
jgi:predicted DNA-binding transcriptional regulator YafY